VLVCSQQLEEYYYIPKKTITPQKTDSSKKLFAFFVEEINDVSKKNYHATMGALKKFYPRPNIKNVCIKWGSFADLLELEEKKLNPRDIQNVIASKEVPPVEKVEASGGFGYSVDPRYFFGKKN